MNRIVNPTGANNNAKTTTRVRDVEIALLMISLVRAVKSLPAVTVGLLGIRYEIRETYTGLFLYVLPKEKN